MLPSPRAPTPSQGTPHSSTCCCNKRVTMGELCWSNTLDRISRPDSTLSTSLGEMAGWKIKEGGVASVASAFTPGRGYR